MTRAGIIIFPTDQTIQPSELAREVEARGFDSLFLPEHTHIPVGSTSPFMPDGVIPEFYKRAHDPFVALSVCAAVTERIKLGTGICLVTQRDPIVLAKQCASLDRVSGGRLVLGVGAGWNREELANHGTAYEKRWPILRERIQAMRTIWRDEEPEFHGEFVDFDPIWSYPKPVQPGGPPVWIGANSKYVPDRVAEYADGWMPIHGRPGGASIDAVKEACSRRGRSFGEISVALLFAPLDPSEAVPLVEAGHQELIYAVPAEDRDTVLKKLDEIQAAVAQLRG